MPAQKSKRTNPSPQLRGPSSQVPARRCQLKASQCKTTSSPQLTGPMSRALAENLHDPTHLCSDAQAHKSQLIPAHGAQFRGPDSDITESNLCGAGARPLRTEAIRRILQQPNSHGRWRSRAVMAWLEQRFAMHSFTCFAGTLHWLSWQGHARISFNWQ